MTRHLEEHPTIYVYIDSAHENSGFQMVERHSGEAHLQASPGIPGFTAVQSGLPRHTFATRATALRVACQNETIRPIQKRTPGGYGSEETTPTR